MDYNKILNQLKESMTFNGEVNERYYHSIGVMKQALHLNEIHHLNLDEEQVRYAGLLHDCAKFMSLDDSIKLLEDNNDPIDTVELRNFYKVVHAFTGKYKVLDYGITDMEIRNAIYYHTTGQPNMTKIEQLIFVADFTDETRTEKVCIEARKRAEESLDKVTNFILTETIDYIKERNLPIYNKTLEAYEYYKQYE